MEKTTPSDNGSGPGNVAANDAASFPASSGGDVSLANKPADAVMLAPDAQPKLSAATDGASAVSAPADQSAAPTEAGATPRPASVDQAAPSEVAASEAASPPQPASGPAAAPADAPEPVPNGQTPGDIHAPAPADEQPASGSATTPPESTEQPRKVDPSEPLPKTDDGLQSPADGAANTPADASTQQEGVSAEGTPAAPEAPPSVPKTGSLRLVIDDDIGHPIPNLRVKILMNDTMVFMGAADAKGEVFAENVPLGENLVIQVRTDSGEYKQVAIATIGCRENVGRLKSPKTKIEVTSMYHHGQPGPAEKEKEKLAQTHNQKPATQPALTGNQPKKPATQAQRNENGNPVVKVNYGLTDWFGLNRLKALLWSKAEAKPGQPAPPNAQTKPPSTAAAPAAPAAGAPSAGTQAAPGSQASATPAPAAPPPTSGALVHLNKLVEFAEKQAGWSYPESATSGTVVDQIRHKTLPTPGTKNVHTFSHYCNKYVKIALAYAEYGVNGAVIGNGVVPAKDMCAPLVQAGFADVTSNFPKVKIKTPYGEFEQADIVYTCPGDIVVYSNLATPGAAGHIDIRTYHGFISDAIWGNARNGFPDLKKYKVIGIYRQHSDTQALARARAFMRIIREHEAKGYKDPYKALHYDPSNKANPLSTFDDLSHHPLPKTNNKPAGAYQIKRQTFDFVSSSMGWPETFTKKDQDRAAIYLLQGRRVAAQDPARTALGYIFEGKIEQAINDTKLWNEWSCLPHNGKEAQLSMPDLLKQFAQYV